LLLSFRKEGLFFLSLLTLSSCALWSRPPLPHSASAPFRHTIYVVRRGYHTDIGLKIGDVSGPLAAVAARFPAAQTILVGFGDRSFVTTRRRWLGDWLLALVPGRGAMLVTGLRTTPDAAFGASSVVRLALDEPRFDGVEAYVNGSFAVAHGAPVWIANGPYLGSLFYASSRTYDLLDTCNTWTSAALRGGGLDAPVAFTLFSGQTMRDARRLAAEGY
jgi:uncharacterized protein (TIGR02117 family)